MAVKTIAFMLPWVDPLSANSNLYNAGVIARIETSIADRAITAGKALEINANIFDQSLNTTDSPTFAGLTVDTDTLFVDAANNRVGIGTTSLAATLHVLTASSSTGATPSASADDLVVERNGFSGVSILSGTTSEGSIYFGDSGSATIGRIVYNHSANDLSFFTNNTKRVTIDSGGDVGIGTTAPDNKIHVRGTANLVAKFENTTASGNARAIFKTPSYEWNIGVNNSGGAFTLYDGTNNIVQVLSGAPSNSLYVNSSGNVGIGTTGPSVRLHANSGSANAVALFESTDAYAYAYLRDNSTTGDTYVGIGAIGNEMILRAGNTDRVRINGSGNVGIGTTSPAQKHHVSSTGTTYARITGGSATYTGLDVGQTSAGDGLIILRDNKSLSFWTNGTRAMDINSSQNVGIGTTSPSQRLHVAGNAEIEATTTGAPYLFLTNETSGELARIFASNSSTFYLQSGGSGDIVFQSTTNSEIARLKGSTGNVGIGTTGPGAKLHVNGNARIGGVAATSSEIGLVSTGSNTYAAGIQVRNYDAAGWARLDWHHQSASGAALLYQISNGSLYFRNDSTASTPFLWNVGSTTAMVLNSSGNVGIGTASANRRLTVRSSAANTTVLAVQNNDNTSEMFTITETSSKHGRLNLRNATNATNVEIHSSGSSYFNGGNVGIGTTGPSAKLHVNGTVRLQNLPTSSSGLSSGDLWNDGGTLKIA